MCLPINRRMLRGAARKAAYGVLFRTPDRVKFSLGMRYRRNKMPYTLIAPGSVVVQVGAPWDILKSGRSRAAYFGLLVQPGGKLLVVEPEEDSVNAFRAFVDKFGLDSVFVEPCGAWSCETRLRFLSDPSHPASNAVQEVGEEGLRTGHESAVIDVKPLDAILEGHGIREVDLVSITTNGSESEILKGLSRHADRIRYISVIGGAKDDVWFATHGFELHSKDDRGYTFERKGETA